MFSVTFFKFQVKTVFSFILIRSVSRQRALIRNPLSPVSFFSPTFLDFIENSSCPVNSGRYRSVSVARVISLLYSQRESRKLTDREESNEIVISRTPIEKFDDQKPLTPEPSLVDVNNETYTT